MLFGPEDGHTWKEIIESVLRQNPPLRAQLEEMAQSGGLSVRELSEEALAIFFDAMKDPAKLFNSEEGMTWEQIIEKVWRELEPDHQAKIQQEMAATGQTWDAICREARVGFALRCVAAGHDPESPFAKMLDHSEFPYGHDPLLERSNP